MDKLKNLDIKEISRKTHIDDDFIKAVLKKDFAKLKTYNYKGLFKVLSREYDIDFTDFLKEFEEFLQADNAEQEAHVNMPLKVESYSQEKPKIPSFALAILALVLVLVCGYYFFDFSKFFVDKKAQEENASSAMVVMLNEAQDKINEELVVDENTSENINENTQEDLNQSENLPSKESEESFENLEQNATQETQGAQEQTEPINNQAIFFPKQKAWVGLIDLNTGAKREFFNDNNFSVDLSKDQLVLVGAVDLTLVNGDEKNEFRAKSGVKRFVVQNQMIKAITLKEFKNLNKGKEW